MREVYETFAEPFIYLLVHFAGRAKIWNRNHSEMEIASQTQIYKAKLYW